MSLLFVLSRNGALNTKNLIWRWHTHYILGNTNMFFHLLSLLKTEIALAVEILFSWKIRICLSGIIHIMAADVMATQAARISAAIVLIYFALNAPASTPEEWDKITVKCLR